MKNYKLHFHMFDGNLNTNVTTQTGAGQNMTPEMKTFWDKALIRLAEASLIHDQFAQKRDIPKGRGKTIEFRRFPALPKALTPLTEGITPDGSKLDATAITATVSQYGDYVATSDMLVLTAFDNIAKEIIELIASQAGRTLDTITREVLVSGTNVRYAGTNKQLRTELTGSDKLSVALIKKAVRDLKGKNAPKIGNCYVALVHPDTVYDLWNDSEWVEASKYAGSTQLFNGEIGKLYGVRFIESTEAKIWRGDNLTAVARNLTVASYANKVITVDEAITSAEATALVGRKIIMHDSTHDEIGTIAAAAAGTAGTATITLKDSPSNEPADGDIVYPGEGGATGCAIYATLVLGKNAFGTTKVEGGGLETIVKQLGSGGTADPLNQRATTGWKAIKVAKILVEEYMVRIEHGATLESEAN